MESAASTTTSQNSSAACWRVDAGRRRRPGRRRRASQRRRRSSGPARCARPARRRPRARWRAGPRAMLRATAGSSSPSRTSSRGSRSSPACRRKSRTVVAPPWRTSTSRVGGHPLQRLAHRGPGDAEHLGQPALAGQGVAGAEAAVDDLAEQLVEDVVGHGAAGDGLEGHAAHASGRVARWSSGQTSTRDGGSSPVSHSGCETAGLSSKCAIGKPPTLGNRKCVTLSCGAQCLREIVARDVVAAVELVAVGRVVPEGASSARARARRGGGPPRARLGVGFCTLSANQRRATAWRGARSTRCRGAATPFASVRPTPSVDLVAVTGGERVGLVRADRQVPLGVAALGRRA